MGAFIARQPNGLICRVSSISGLTHYNMTEDDYVKLCVERAEKEARYNLEHGMYNFSMVNEYCASPGNTKFKKILEEMKKPPHLCKYTEA